MEGFPHRGAVIAIASTSIVLLALALLQPWFIVNESETWYETETGVLVDTSEHETQFYTGYYRSAEMSGGYWWDFESFQEDSALSDLMGFMNSGMLLCIGLCWLLIMVALLNSRLLTLILAWGAAMASLLCVVVFAGLIPIAVSNIHPEDWHWPIVHGLFGEKTIDQFGEVYSGTSLWSWHPGWGWYMAFAAGILLLATAALSLLGILRKREEDVFHRQAESSASKEPDANPETMPVERP